MTYLRILRAVSNILRSLMRRCDKNGRLWAELAWHDGHIAFRQIDYAERVRKASGWEPVEVVTAPLITWTCPPASPGTWTTTNSDNTTVRYIRG